MVKLRLYTHGSIMETVSCLFVCVHARREGCMVCVEAKRLGDSGRGCVEAQSLGGSRGCSRHGDGRGHGGSCGSCLLKQGFPLVWNLQRRLGRLAIEP